MEAVHDYKEEQQSNRGRQTAASRMVTNIFAFIAVTAVLLVLVELISFVAMRVLRSSVLEETPGKRMMAAYKGQPWAAALAREEKASREFYNYEPFTIWRSRPFHGEAVNIDQEGLRRTYNSSCEGNEYTIWTFGGSTMRGNGSPDWGTIPSQLAGMFQKSGKPVCVRNYGEGAWVSTQELTQLMLALKKESRKPNLVLFYDGANDTYVPYQNGRGDVHMNFDTIRSQFESQRSLRQGSFGYLLHLNTVQLVFSLAAHGAVRAGDRPVPTKDADALAHETVSNYFENMDIVEGMAHQYGFEYAFFWQPVLFASHKDLLGDETQIRDSKSQEHLAQWVPRVYDLVAQQKRPHFYDIADVFDKTHDKLFLDWCHIDMSGNQLVAQRMYDVLQSSAN
jgi:hypothetical protein